MEGQGDVDVDEGPSTLQSLPWASQTALCQHIINREKKKSRHHGGLPPEGNTGPHGPLTATPSGCAVTGSSLGLGPCQGGTGHARKGGEEGEERQRSEGEGRKEGLRTACRLSRLAPAPGRATRERGKGTEQAGSSNQQKTQRQRSEDERCFTTVNQSQRKERDKTTQRTRQTTTVPGKPALFLRGELRRPEAERAPAALRAGAPPHFHSASRPPGMPPRPFPPGAPNAQKAGNTEPEHPLDNSHCSARCSDVENRQEKIAKPQQAGMGS